MRPSWIVAASIASILIALCIPARSDTAPPTSSKITSSAILKGIELKAFLVALADFDKQPASERDEGLENYDVVFVEQDSSGVPVVTILFQSHHFRATRVYNIDKATLKIRVATWLG